MCKQHAHGPGVKSCELLCVGMFAVLFILPSSVAFGQMAHISGQVTDVTGAVVPGAAVTALNVATGVPGRVTTNQSGMYVIPFLKPGVYSIRVEKPGFKGVTRPNVKLDVKQAAQIDFVLQVGAVTQEITVTGGTPKLQTESASVGQVVENAAVNLLPLNGRDYLQLALLGTGAAPDYYSVASNGFSINGNRPYQNKILLNGIDNTNYELGSDSHSLQALQPSVDAIQEFKVSTANYSAQYGNAAGGIVSVVIKSGTNDFHGSLYEFLRNDALDANDFFANRAGLPRPPLKRNQFGGTLGGPIVHNHSFFFIGYEGTRLASARTVTTTVPSPAMISGDFGSTAIYDPQSVVNGIRKEFTNNTIPSSRLDPVGAKLAGLYPSPNQAGAVNNYTSNVSDRISGDELDSRFDQTFSQKDTAFFTYSRGISTETLGSVFAPPGNGGNASGDYPLIGTARAYLVMVGETHVFSPTLVNEFRAGYTHNEANHFGPETQPLFEQFGLDGIPPQPGLNGLPTISVAGFSNLGDKNFNPNPKLVQITQASDKMSWVHGKHSFDFGGRAAANHNFAGTSDNARSMLTFNGQFTSKVPGNGQGSALADLLLGQTSSARITSLLIGRFRSQQYALYANDAWRATRKLTLNLGLRYELQTPMTERDNRMGSFVLDPQSPDYGTVMPVEPGGPLGRGLTYLNTDEFAPRAGVAYRLNPKTVIRSGAGVFYGDFGAQSISQSGASNPPYFLDVTYASSTSASRSAMVLSNGFPPGTLSPASITQPAAFSVESHFPMPSVYQWNFTLERELPGDIVLTTAYIGSGTAHLESLANINDALPGPGPVNARRPFPNFGTIQFQGPFAHETYHSLQVRAERRFTNGFMLLSSYTWSHAIDNVVSEEDIGDGQFPQNPRDTGAEKSNSGLDVRNRFVTSGIYNLPLGTPGQWSGRSRVGRYTLRGWQVGGIFVAQDGPWLTPSVTPNPANTTGTARPNRICNGNLPGNVRTINQWFDVGCFVPEALYTFGNSARNVLLAPGLVNLDSFISRDFQISESKKLEFRAEFFNMFNSAHFAPPALNVTQRQAGTITSTASPNREIELALHLWF